MADKRADNINAPPFETEDLRANLAKSSDDLRSRTMRAVRSKNTKPEMIVRRVAHALGFRFRLHRADLPGKPDLVFPSRHAVIFVHGCFWHGHGCTRGARIPKENREYWLVKVRRNRERDARNLDALTSSGWQSLVVWECDLKDRKSLADRILTFLHAGRRKTE